MKLLLTLALAALAAAISLKIDINPRVLFAGGTVRVRCTVPPSDQNRWLDFGIQDYRVSRDELPGPVTHEVYIPHVPCDVGPAFCAVTNAAGKTRVVTATLQVAGCEP